ncbi:MAG: hypothetical protein QOD26_2646 [Betaproteobacteria bacterium]|nr:hypothetical protein [Betaproteobacteria bacterium]
MTIFPAIATVTAAFVAAFVAFLSSVLSKEQKTSEFRYTWLNAVLDDIAKFTGAAESISGTAWSHFKTEGPEKAQVFLAGAEPQIRDMLGAYYRARIRLYPLEHEEVLKALESLQALFLKSDIPDPAKVDPLVRDIVRTSHEALKAEWGRVKRGETTFRWIKHISLFVIVLALALAIGFAGFMALGHQSPETATPRPAAEKKALPVVKDPQPRPPAEKKNLPVVKDPQRSRQ